MGQNRDLSKFPNAITVLDNGNVGIGTTSFSEGTQPSGTISIIPNSSVSSGPLVQFAGNGRIRPASAGDRLSIDGNALFLNSTFNGNIVMATGGGNVGIGTGSINTNVKVKIKASSEGTGIGLSSSTLCIARVATDTQLNIGYYSTPDAWVISSSYGSDGAYKPIVFATSDAERMRISTNGQLSLGTYHEQVKFCPGADSNHYLTYNSSADGLELSGYSSVVFSTLGGTERARFNTNGVFTIPNQPAFSVYQYGQSGPSGVMTYNTTILNRGNCVNLSNGRFTAPVGGAYQISFMAFQQTGTSGVLTCILYKNGSPIPVRTYQNDPSSEYGPHATISVVLSLAANDFIYVNVAAGQIHGNDDGYFSGFLIG